MTEENKNKQPTINQDELMKVLHETDSYKDGTLANKTISMNNPDERPDVDLSDLLPLDEEEVFDEERQAALEASMQELFQKPVQELPHAITIFYEWDEENGHRNAVGFAHSGVGETFDDVVQELRHTLGHLMPPNPEQGE